jgi:hypothetical protein
MVTSGRGFEQGLQGGFGGYTKKGGFVMLSGFFGVVDHRYFSNDCLSDGIDNLFKAPGNVIVIGNFAALSAYPRRHILDNNNAISNIRSESGTAVLYFAFAHKTSHFASSCRTLKFSDHSYVHYV